MKSRGLERVVCNKCGSGLSSNMPQGGEPCYQKGCTGTLQPYVYTGRVARLRITTWVDTSAIGARHYYGRITFRDDEYELSYRISAKEARLLNKDDHGAGYKAGDTSSRFESKEKLFESAARLFEKELIPKGCALLLGGDSASPEAVVAFAPEAAEDAAKLEELNIRFENIGGFDGNDEELADELSDQFRSIIEKWGED